jgi:hypothetical protein
LIVASNAQQCGTQVDQQWVEMVVCNYNIIKNTILEEKQFHEIRRKACVGDRFKQISY